MRRKGEGHGGAVGAGELARPREELLVTAVDPVEIYRALRIVNPSPYMIYLQATGCILVGASPEILCRTRGGVVTSRPLAGTRREGAGRAHHAG